MCLRSLFARNAFSLPTAKNPSNKGERRRVEDLCERSGRCEGGMRRGHMTCALSLSRGTREGQDVRQCLPCSRELLQPTSSPDSWAKKPQLPAPTPPPPPPPSSSLSPDVHTLLSTRGFPARVDFLVETPYDNDETVVGALSFSFPFGGEYSSRPHGGNRSRTALQTHLTRSLL